MKTCAIILARGGSKGIPRKNLQALGGLSLLARCVRTAEEAKTIERVFVSTDDDEIHDEASSMGADVIGRPPSLASDTASSEAGLMHALSYITSEYGYSCPTPEVFAFLQCTAPLMIADDIDRCVSALLAGGADSVFCAAAFHGYVWDGNNWPAGKLRKRRQDDMHRVLEAGSCYAIRTERFLAECTRFCGKVGTVEIPASRCLEIDTMEDLERAREIIEGRRHAIAG